MTGLTCPEVRDLAAELAVGALPGDERAAALVHLEHCPECQVLVEELGHAADALLFLASEADPPAGFAGRVVANLKSGRPRRRFWMAATAAAVVIVLGGGAALAATIGHQGPKPAPAPAPSALQAPGVRITQLVAVRGESVGGQVFSYTGSPSWIFMTVHETASSETYICELELNDGARLRIGTFRLQDGVGSWGRTLSVNGSQISAVHLIKSTGETAASGPFG